MVPGFKKLNLIIIFLIPTSGFGYNQNSYGSNNYGSSNNSSSSNNQFAAILQTPTLNGFGDSDLNDANWDTIDFSNSDTGTAGWSGGGGGKGATSGKNPFGFPDEDFTPQQGSTAVINGGG